MEDVFSFFILTCRNWLIGHAMEVVNGKEMIELLLLDVVAVELVHGPRDRHMDAMGYFAKRLLSIGATFR
jgi:hypothetical protein